MVDEQRSQHLPPEIFVDVVENVPVEASFRRHLESCESCREQLVELEEALTFAREGFGYGTPEEPGVFDPGLRQGVASPEASRKSGPHPYRRTVIALATAAAVVLGMLALFGPAGDPEIDAVSIGVDYLLPPVERDEDYQWLVGLSDLTEPDDATGWDRSITAGSPLSSSVPDIGDLTPAERQRLVEQLAQEMRTSS